MKPASREIPNQPRINGAKKDFPFESSVFYSFYVFKNPAYLVAEKYGSITNPVLL